MEAHVPFRYANGHARCERCGAILATEPATSPLRGMIWLQDSDDPTDGKALVEGAEIPAGYAPCPERDWEEELVHVSGGSGQCSRCGEELFLLGDELAGTEIVLRLTKRAGEPLTFSGSMQVLSSGFPADMARCSPTR